jgi:hypothetical protein
MPPQERQKPKDEEAGFGGTVELSSSSLALSQFVMYRPGRSRGIVCNMRGINTDREEIEGR